MIGMTVCSGIGAPEIAAPFIDWRYQSEIEKFPCAVLKARFPHAVNYGDMTKFEEWPDHAIDVLCGGTPCQDYSVAGLRAGLGGERGNLMLTYGQIARRYRPAWLVWENVPGVFSSNEGRDFGSLLGLLSGRRIEVPKDGWRNSGVVPGYENAYGLAWRVLDAQFVRVESHPWAVPQRRRRVFVVGYLGDWRRAAAVLFEPESLSGHSPPGREKGQRIAGTIEASLGRSRGSGQSTSGLTECVAPTLNTSWADRSPGSQAQEFDSQKGGMFVPADWPGPVAPTLDAGFGKRHGQNNQAAAGSYFVPAVSPAMKSRDYKGASSDGDGDGLPVVAHALRGEGHDATDDGTGRGTPIIPTEAGPGDVIAFEAKGSQVQTDENGAALTLRSMNHDKSHASGGGHMAVAFQPRFARNGRGAPDEVAAALTGEAGTTGKGDSAQCVATQMAVRRLTPLECERLQGFPDGHTDIEIRNKPAPDGPRYKALGNSMAVNVMNWVLSRIHERELSYASISNSK